MKRTIYLLVCFIAFYVSNYAGSEKIILVKNGKSNYKIVFSANTNKWDTLAGFELKKYIKEISGAGLEINGTSNLQYGNEIIFEKDESLKEDGFKIKTEGNKLFISGGVRRGTLNAVYGFLEKYLNCRMYTSTVKVIPKKSTIIISQINMTENPIFPYRDIHYKEAWEREFSYWHKLDADSESKKIWGLFVHTFNRLMPPEKYFKDHPEYYSELNGIRVPDGQLCLSNPEVFKIVAAELRERIKANPTAKIWSVSQNDNFSNCRCAECSKLDALEGSPAGSLLVFVNKVAKEFPDKIISTLAYQYTRKAPKTIKPEKNVNIMLCSIECNRSKALAEDPNSADFVNDLKEWSSISDNIMIWDYVVQFKNTVSPFPNFHVLQPNIQLFAKYGVKMMFQQGAGGCIGAEFGELRNYIIAKLLWNPNVNVDLVINDFLSGYYGKAGKYIRKYIDIMTAELKKSNADLLIYGNPIAPMKHYLSADLMDRYNNLFDDAEKAVKDNPEILKRVIIARLPLKYAMLEQAKVIGSGKRGLVVKDKARLYSPNKEMENLLGQFYNESKLTGRLVVNESQVSAESYKSMYENLLSKTMKNPLGLNKPVRYLTAASSKYPANGVKTLTDGSRGVDDYNFNWLGYEAEDLDVIADLLKVVPVKKISIDFLQDNNSWIFMPQMVEISISNDGNEFRTIAVVNNTEPEEKGGAFIKTFSTEALEIKSRYIKVKATNMKICPKWHKGYPGKAWIFADEIVIE